MGFLHHLFSQHMMGIHLTQAMLYSVLVYSDMHVHAWSYTERGTWHIRAVHFQ